MVLNHHNQKLRARENETNGKLVDLEELPETFQKKCNWEMEKRRIGEMVEGALNERANQLDWWNERPQQVGNMMSLWCRIKQSFETNTNLTSGSEGK